MSITIKDVAKRAGVSTATVSRIINNKPGYSEETKKKVLKAIDELDYHPNVIARGLVSKRTQTIAVLVPHLSSILISMFLRGIEDITHKMGSSVIVCHTESNGKKTMKYLQLLRDKQIDAIIFVSEILKEDYYQFIKKMGIPLVLLSTKSFTHQVPYVKVDDRLAAYTATEYLIQKGHRKIGMLCGNKDDMIAGQPRIDGFLSALRSYNIPYNERNLVSTKGFNFKDGIEGCKKLIKQFPDMSAIFAASDEMAIGVLRTAYEMGINVPAELSVIGYDNLDISQMSIPPLTSVSQPLVQMGKLAAEMIFEMLRTNNTVESRILPHEIVERESVKAL